MGTVMRPRDQFYHWLFVNPGRVTNVIILVLLYLVVRGVWRWLS